jgi:hypothetical protein
VALTPSVVKGTVDIGAGVATLTVPDFEAVQPRLSVIQLDEEFVAIWKASIPINPAGFAALLLDRLDGARASVALYPGGVGNVNMVVENGGVRQAVLQLRFDLGKGEMHVDEIRVAEDARGTGLFQRLEYNTEELATALGLHSTHVYATEMGSIAFARVGSPRDPELHAKAHRRG